MKLFLFICSCSFSYIPLAWNDTYQPHAHPARISKIITGTTRPRLTMVISSEVSGLLLSMPVDLGDHIEREQNIHIDDTQIQLAIQQLNQELSIAQSQHRSSQILGKKLDQQLEFLGKELLRSQTLLKQKGMSQQTVDQQQQALDQFKLELEQQDIQQKIFAQNAQQLGTRIQQQKDWLKRHHLQLPLGWTVLDRHKEVGEVVQMGQPILTLVDLRSQLIDLYLDTMELMSLENQSLTFRYRHHSIQPKASLFHVSPLATQNRKQKVTYWLKDCPPQSCGSEISLTLKQKDPEHLVIPEKYSTQAYGQTLVELEDGQTIPIFPIRKSDEGWVIPASSLGADVKLVSSQQKMK